MCSGDFPWGAVVSVVHGLVLGWTHERFLEALIFAGQRICKLQKVEDTPPEGYHPHAYQSVKHARLSL